MRIKSRKYKDIARIIRLCCITGAMFAYSSTAYATIAVDHNRLPVGGTVLHGNVAIDTGTLGNTMNVTQTGGNAVIKWQYFSIGTNATVNFKESNNSNFNVLNYVDSGVISQIYGNLNAEKGNVFLVNTAGALISKSAEINVGSLYVSNRDMSADNLKAFYDAGTTPVVNGTVTSAELMNLGHIKANKVTFDGDRVVLDLDYIKKNNANGTVSNLEVENIIVKTADIDNVVVGYTAYDETKKTYAGQNPNTSGNIVTVTENDVAKAYTKADGYMWVKDVEQLQKMNTNLSGHFALKNSIDAIATKDWDDNFIAIGKDGDEFTGKFDGLDNNIFGLTVTQNSTGANNNVGLFGVTENATVRNVDMIAGSVSGASNVGSIAGKAIGGEISNITTSMEISGSIDGSSNIGGIVGETNVYVDLVNAKIEGTKLSALDNVGTVQGKTYVGGIVGYLYGGTLDGGSFNMGYVKGVNTANTSDSDTGSQSSNIGGLVGYADRATLGAITDKESIANKMEVSGGYNVGGIVGTAVDSNIFNAVNSGDVTATWYTTEEYKYHSDYAKVKEELHYSEYDSNTKIVTIDNVFVSNVGGIVGNVKSSDGTKEIIKNIYNTGDIQSTLKNGENYYYGGNIGGVAGRSSKIIIENANNDENIIRGGHNIGGIVGYIDEGEILTAANTGEIMGTGAYGTWTETTGSWRPTTVTYTDAIEEIVRSDFNGNNNERYIIGNIGGIVGYMYGDNNRLENSGNRGHVHTLEITSTSNVSKASKASNLGGVVGKMDSQYSYNGSNLNNIHSIVNTAYNTGNVEGYLNVGGVVGQMYNGVVEHTHNLGNVQTTRPYNNQSAQGPVNMGGVIGDTTEMGSARVYINDVYNAGKIGTENFDFYGRHVGGVVGRLSGDINKAYNNGDIFMGSNVVGGVVGYWYAGDLENIFNTGNITVINNSNATSQVGGLVGGVDVRLGYRKITNAYNLGSIRSFMGTYNGQTGGNNTVAGIVGGIFNYDGSGRPETRQLQLKNVYTLGNIYSSTNDAKDVYGEKEGDAGISTENVYFVKPKDGSAYAVSQYQSNKQIAFGQRNDITNYQYTVGGKTYKLNFVTHNNNSSGDVTGTGEWRNYSNTMPILNAFLPNVESYFAENFDSSKMNSIQYGTAFNPLLIIIDAKEDISLNWGTIGADDHTSLAVYNKGLALSNFNLNNKMYGGILYADGDLYISNSGSNADGSDAVKIGSCADIYGSTISINSGTKDLIVYGNVQATAKDANSHILEDGSLQDNTITSDVNTPNPVSSGSVVLNGQNIQIIGSIRAAAKDADIKISGIGSGLVDSGNYPFGEPGDVQNAKEHITHIGDLHSYPNPSAGTGQPKSLANGDVTIKATNNVDVLVGVGKQGLLDVPGDLSITSTNGNVYIDSDIYLNNASNNLSKFTISANNGEVVLDLSNLGTVKNVGQAEHAISRFAGIFNSNNNKLNLNSTNAIIAMDMWNGAAYSSDKFGTNVNVSNLLNNLKLGGDITTVRKSDESKVADASDITYLWVSSAKQLDYLGETISAHLLEHNFALKNDINANHITNFNGIGYRDQATYDGTFDGRGYSIVGLDSTMGNKGAIAKPDGAPVDLDYGGRIGIFNTIGQTGVVKNLKVYHSEVEGGAAGSVAGVNYGKIENVYTFGNKVESNGVAQLTILDSNGTTETQSYLGAAGGVVGINYGKIIDSDSNNIVIAGHITDADNDDVNTGYDSVAGGVAGLNTNLIQYAVSDSAITASHDADSLGGIAGVSTNRYFKNSDNTIELQEAKIQSVESYGLVNGTYNSTENSTLIASAGNVGGIVGTLMNEASLEGAFNEAEVKGANMVGGIVGYSGHGTDWNISISGKHNTITNVINSGSIDGKNYVGGLIGYSDDTKLNGARNTGEIFGEDYVGGIVGNNSSNSEMSNIVNDNKASISGIRYVGGVAGSNSGTISADSMHLDNNGKIYGKQYVGGIVGRNTATGKVENTINDITLYVNSDDVYYSGNLDGTYTYVEDGTIGASKMEAQYFGGVVGKNEGTITNAENRGSVNADGAVYVGGIVGHNSGALKGAGNSNNGLVQGDSYVGGVGGYNASAIDGSVYETDDNDQSILVSESTTVKNQGTVIADAGGAGGIWGYNAGAITNMIMINDGKVYGTTGGTGGIIATNIGNISNSSLINTVGGVVVGTDTVGGLIGINSGSITGGRDSADNYYKYHISNNGHIKAHTWTLNSDGTITVDTDVLGDNVGGLVGSNSSGGTITAAYNTGNVTGAENVGGIVGLNSADIDQVFSADGATISGTSNVGGLIGSNSGSLNDYYNLSDVVVNGTKNDDKPEIGSGTPASGNDTTNSNIWKTYDGGTTNLLKVFLTKAVFEQTNLDFAYNAHDHKLVVKAVANLDVNGIANGTHSVKVFAIDQTTNTEVEIGIIKTASNDANAAHSLADYLNTSGSLISTNTIVRNAADYDNFLTSRQIDINGKDGSHNNLGFDFVSSRVTVDKATIDLVLNSVTRVYGDAELKNGTSYGFRIDSVNGLTGSNINNELLSELSGKVTLDDVTNDGATNGCSGNRKTNDVSDAYVWVTNANIDSSISGNYQFSNKSNVKEFAGNSSVTQKALNVTLQDVTREYGDVTGKTYAINTHSGLVNGDDASKLIIAGISDGALAGNDKTQNVGSYKWTGVLGGIDNLNTNYAVTITEGNSTVTKVDLDITIDDLTTVYGTAFDTTKYNYTIEGHANGDTDAAIRELIGVVSYNNTGIGTGGSNVTGNVGDYALSFVNNVNLNNYNVSVTNGTAKVAPATLTVNANNSSVNYGDKPTYSGSVTGFVNGDSAQSLGYEEFSITDSNLEATPGVHNAVIGLVVGNSVIIAGEAFGNYQLDVTPGTLTVADQFIIDDPMDDKHKIWYAQDRYAWYIWDKKNERERKAEVHFIDGATKL